jgi:hypothetical protein
MKNFMLELYLFVALIIVALVEILGLYVLFDHFYHPKGDQILYISITIIAFVVAFNIYVIVEYFKHGKQ